MAAIFGMALHPHETSVLSAVTRVTGRITGSGPLRIEGSVTGDINVSGEAELAEGAQVEGNLQADGLDIGGRLFGDAEARTAITVRAGAHVRGELRAGEVSIEPGARVSVRLETPFELDFGVLERRRSS